jgi:hypothetical protein
MKEEINDKKRSVGIREVRENHIKEKRKRRK